MATTLSRRGVLLGAAGTAGGVAGCSSLGASGAMVSQAAASEGAHEHHDHGDMAASKPTAMDNHTLHALLHCKAASEACLTHCLNSLATSDPTLAACAARVRETAAICDAAIVFVSAGSPYSAEVLAACRTVCEACLAECEKHAGHHKTCADCAASCAKVIEAIDA